MADAFGEVVEHLRRVTVQIKADRNGSGSGVIWSGDGRIVTNAHVVESAGSSGAAEVELWDGRRLRAEIVTKNRRRDLALLQVQASGLPAASSGDSSALRVGELVIAVGNPLGFIGAASTGVIHQADNRSWVVSQLRLAPGNSGGPLANARGEVVGINTMIATGGLAFAVPSRAVSRFLMAPRQPNTSLGVVVRPIPLPHSPYHLGLIVLEVIPRSPADAASLLQGDILLAVGSKPFESVQDLESAIQASSGGIFALQFRPGGSENIRTVAVRMALASMRAA